MSSTLILPDLHLKHALADQILSAEKGNYSRVICAGDVFDDFNDTVEENRKTAEWFVEKINDPSWVMLRSNHSISYEFSYNRHAYCSGFTLEKAAAINKIVSREDWNKQKTFHYTENFLFTHAGLCKGFLDMMVDSGFSEHFEYTIENILKHLSVWEARGLEALETARSHPFFGAGWDRGGDQKKGSPIWVDFSSLVNIPGLKQICFHTPCIFPDLKYVRADGRNLMQDVMNPILKKTKVNFENGVSYNLDTHLSHYATLGNDTLCIFEIVFDKPRKTVHRSEYKMVGKNLIYKKEFRI
jgi:hypothetical protein